MMNPDIIWKIPPNVLEKRETKNETPAIARGTRKMKLSRNKTAETKESINYGLVSKMGKGGILVNTARKEVINEPDMLKLMAERADLKYVTDIKPDADAEFAKFEGRYFSTPKKMGAQTAEANTNAGIAAARQINAFFATGDTKFQVNK